MIDIDIIAQDMDIVGCMMGTEFYAGNDMDPLHGQHSLFIEMTDTIYSVMIGNRDIF